MVAKMGQDGHDRGAKVVSTAYADMGFDVDIGPLSRPEEAAPGGCGQRRAHRGHILLAAGHRLCCPPLVGEAQSGREDIMVIAGGVIPPQDYAFLYEHGATCIFGPGSIIPECAKEMLIALNKRLGYTD